MPGLVHESEAIFRWLSQEVSPDTYVNIMSQYRPAYRVGQIDVTGQTRYKEIDRAPKNDELAEACAAAHRAGLTRFDERWA
jgi:putative pyruvate formate lyase activating enzyme